MNVPFFMSEDAFTSQMANNGKDLERVLRLRRKHFGAEVIVPDDSYWACWTREQDSMKIVCDEAGQDLGYWALFPVEEEVFRQFLNGELTHGQILANHVLGWDSVVTSSMFLYVVGVVVPSAGAYVSGRVLLDMFSFVIDIMERMDVAGIFGYPSCDSGYKMFEHMGFTNSGVIVGNDDGQPVFYVSEIDGHLAGIKHELLKCVRKEFKRVPIWREDDRRRFLTRITQESSP